MTPPDLDALEALAKAATPGPWSMMFARTTLLGAEAIVITTGTRGNDDSQRDAEYIAAASPDVVLTLIAEVRRVRKELFELSVLILEETEYDDTNPDDAIRRCVKERDEAIAATRGSR